MAWGEGNAQNTVAERILIRVTLRPTAQQYYLYMTNNMEQNIVEILQELRTVKEELDNVKAMGKYLFMWIKIIKQ